MCRTEQGARIVDSVLLRTVPGYVRNCGLIIQ
jgi:hypothetical protein